MPYHKRGVYDGFDSPAEMRRHYKRCRTRKDFIPSQRFIDRTDPTCPCCKRKCSDHGDAGPGYRSWVGVYIPRTKQFRVMHYVCSWNGLLSAIFSMRSES